VLGLVTHIHTPDEGRRRCRETDLLVSVYGLGSGLVDFWVRGVGLVTYTHTYTSRATAMS